MKFFSFLLIILSLPLFAQPDGWVQTDVGQGHIVICRQKTKVGIWSNARGEFLDPPHKGHILHLTEPQMLLDVYPKDKKVKVYHYYQGGVQLIEGNSDSGKFWLGHIKKSEWDTKLEVNALSKDGEKYSPPNTTVLCKSKEDRFNEDLSSYFEYTFNRNLLNVTFCHTNSRDDEIFPVKSVLEPELDSIDKDGNVVYYPRDEMNIFNSGCFDLIKGNWVIPPVYEKINNWEGIYGAYFWPDETHGFEFIGKGIVFDFYHYDKKAGMQPTEFMKYQKFAFPLELWPFQDEEVWYDYDSIYVYHRNKNGVGMYEIPLTGKNIYYDSYTLDWYSCESHFEVKELFQPKYNYIVMGGNLDYYLSPNKQKRYYILANKKSNEFDILFKIYEREEHFKTIDTLIEDVIIEDFIELVPATVWKTSNTRSDQEEITGFIDHGKFIRPNPVNGELDSSAQLLPRYERASGETETYYKSKLIGNNKMVVFSYEFENWANALPYYDENYEQVVNENGELLYYPPDQGKYATGLFDCKASKWIIPPTMISIYPGNGGYVIERPVLKQNRYLDHIVFDFMKEDGTYEFQDLSPEEFKKPKYSAYKIYNFNPLEVIKVDPSNEKYVYFKTDKGYGLSSLSNYRGKIMANPTEMVYYQYDSDCIFAIDEDTLDLTIYDGITGDWKRLNYRMPLVAGSGIQPFGYVIENESFKWYEGHDGFPAPLQFVAFSKDTALWFEAKKDPLVKYADAYKIEPCSDPGIYDYKSDFGHTQIGSNNLKWEFKVEAFTDELIYFQHNEAQGDAILLYNEEDYYSIDSMVVNGYNVYEQGLPEFTHSGVWNRSTKNWEVPNIYKSVAYISGHHFLVQARVKSTVNEVMVDKFILFQNGKKTTLFEGDFSTNEIFNTGRISDSLIYVNHHKLDLGYFPLMSELDPLMDSLDKNGDVVYHQPEKGFYKSGVYNVYTNQWIVPQSNYLIWIFEDSFLVGIPQVDADGMFENNLYDLYDLYGNKINKDPMQAFALEEKYRKLLGLELKRN